MSNATLQSVYDRIYTTGSIAFHAVDNFEESLAIQRFTKWGGMRVLEIGCGEGRLAALISMSGAKEVVAIDYSESGIDIAKSRFRLPNLYFRQCEHRDVKQRFDVVVMQGVLEHFDDWRKELQFTIDCLIEPGGCVITSSPSFSNPRGYVWMALQLLLNVPMSLTDRAFIGLHEMQRFCADRYRLQYRSIDHDWSLGKTLISDFRKRLTNALADASLDNSRVEKFLDWLGHATKNEMATGWNGATMLYRIDT